MRRNQLKQKTERLMIVYGNFSLQKGIAIVLKLETETEREINCRKKHKQD